MILYHIMIGIKGKFFMELRNGEIKLMYDILLIMHSRKLKIHNRTHGISFHIFR